MHIKSFAVTLLASLALASSAFATKQTDEKHTKVGNATYYGDRWHGRRTADGSAYNKAAAKQIDMVQAGVASVEVTPVVKATAPASKEKTSPILPELQLLDPTTGRYYTMTQWQERADRRKEMAKNSAAKQPQQLMAKKATPRYRVKSSVKLANAKKR